MLDITTIILPPNITRGFRRVAVLAVMFAFGIWNFSALAHPGSGIAVDQRGRVYFTDTGGCATRVDPARAQDFRRRLQ